MEVIEQLDVNSWQGPFNRGAVAKAATSLEEGKILFLPRLRFDLSDAERRFLTPACLDGKSKNVCFRPVTGVLTGTAHQGKERDELLRILDRYRAQARALMAWLCPAYRDHLEDGYTSFRPVEIADRVTSWRKDDTRLHVDAFPSRPVQGRRILRVFTNVNRCLARLWRVGESFEEVAARFLPHIRAPLPGSSWLLYHLHIVKGRRTPYDHFMAGIHDHMKADEHYQSHVSQVELPMPPGASWACFTDSVSHAAMSGQFAFEQTFYLPVAAMLNPLRSPLRILERLLGTPLARTR
jgi:3-deoxy-D-manno-oct-2-ulosonic acid (Kdo) hydroxylase